ncbi:MAG: TonB-dependent receptor [Pseudomonadota bacterium]
MKKVPLRASSVLTLAAIGVSHPAMAQTQVADASTSTLETIIVTAQKRTENVQDAPLAISAVSGATIAKDRVTSINDLAQTMTGISFTSNSPQANEINIRGVVNTRLTGPTADQSVSTFVDDVYAGRSGVLNTAFYDVARIEVVRGPQGVLLGKNVAGGAVNVISNKPTQDPSGMVTLTIGNYDLRQVNGFVNGGIADGLSGRISFQAIKHSGYAYDLLHKVDLENLDSTQGRFQLAYEPAGSGFKGLFIADYSQTSDDGVNRVGVKSPTLPAGLTPWSGTRALISAALGRTLGPRESYPVWPQFAGDSAPSPQSATRDNYSLILKLSQDLGNAITVSSITGYRNNTSYTLYDQTGLGPNNGFNFTPAQLASAGASVLFAEPVNFRETGNYFTQELRLQSTDDDRRLSWIVGAFYLKSNVTQRNRFWGESLVLPTLSGESQWIDSGQNEDYAAFAQLGYKLTDTLKIEAGIRYTHDSKSGNQQGIIVATGDRYNPADPTPLTPLTTNFNTPYGKSWSDTTPQVTLSWKPNDLMMAYATYSQGFKGGGFLNNASSGVAATIAYDPESVTNYEIGYKAELFDRRVRWNSAVFLMKYKNLQVQQTLASCLCNVISNAASASIKGIESDLQIAPSRKFHAWLSGTYLDATYDDFVFAGVNNSGNKLQRTPQFQFAVGAEVSMGTGDWEDAFTARLAYRYQGKMPWAPENTAWENPYGTLDGRVTFQLPNRNWSVSAFAKNLTDELYRTNIIVFFQEEMSSYAPPRTYGLEVTAKF